MRILITGASGFVGWNAVRHFADRGCEVIATLRSLPHYLHKRDGVGTVELDLADGSAIEQVVARFQPDVILHAAAITRPQRSSDFAGVRLVNVEATARLAASAALHGAGIVLLSTDLVYASDAGLCDEATPVRPSGAGYYAESKVEAELAVRRSGARWIVLRPSLMFGDGPSGGNSFSHFIERCWAAAQPAPLFTDQFRSFLFVEDLCAAIHLVAVEHGAWDRLFVCGGPERMSRADFGVRFADCMGIDRSMVRPMLSTELEGYQGGPSDIALDSARLRHLGWKPASVGDGLARMLAGRRASLEGS